MAQYQHPDGEESPQFIGVYREFKVRVDDEGYYETDVDPDVLREHGFLADDNEPEEVDSTELPKEEWDITKPLDEHNHDELKQIAEDFEIEDEIDLRSKESIRAGIEKHTHLGGDDE